MLFHSPLFLFWFLPVALAVYYLCPARLKNAALLVSGLFFYAWGDLMHVPLLLGAVALGYAGGRLLERAKDKKRLCRLLLALLCAALGGLLFVCRYLGPLLSFANTAFGLQLPLPGGTAPLGVGVYTLLTVAYAVQVYRGTCPAEKNILRYGAYITLFPLAIAGPLLPYGRAAETLRTGKGRVSMADVDDGLQYFIFGLAQKLLLADNIGKLWTGIVGETAGGKPVLGGEGIGLSAVSAPLAWLAVLALALQVYYDFSGYCAMATGLLRMLGFEAIPNMDSPCAARSVTEFWCRWNITLFAWLKEYIYTPLAGAKNGLRALAALAAAVLLGALWYGGSGWLLLCGAWFLLFFMLEKLWLGRILQKGRVWPRLYTLAAVLAGFVLFAAARGGGPLPLLLHRLFVPQGGQSALYYARNYIVPLLLGLVCLTPLPGWLFGKIERLAPLRLLALLALLAASVAYMVGGAAPFVFPL